MTDNEIIKALECCRKKECSTCPCYDDEIECGEMLIGHTIDLINRLQADKEALINGQETLQKHIAEQKAEIEKLTTELVGMRGAANSYKMHYDNAQAEIKELKSDLILKTNDYEHLLMKCKELQAISASRKDRLMQTVVKLQTAKTEAIKEFAERLKEKAITKYDWNDCIEVEDIDNLVKEMVGENK